MCVLPMTQSTAICSVRGRCRVHACAGPLEVAAGDGQGLVQVAMQELGFGEVATGEAG